ncbi:hypothetical protein [Cyanobium sp. A2C-AMD]|nr:hypothetical protein [Cyanobium sp. A2C-AMD]MCP9877330.1 hypothetical protein [Cyanobium sp. A2C-AMD]
MTDLTQAQIESLSPEEYSNYLASGPEALTNPDPLCETYVALLRQFDL